MGSSVSISVTLDHETLYQRKAIDAGNPLQGKVVVDVKTVLEPTNLYLEVHGKEKTYSVNDDGTPGPHRSNTATATGKGKCINNCFFLVRLDLYRTEKPIMPNQYVIPFSVPLPKSLPASRSNVGIKDTLNTRNDDHQLLAGMLSSFSVQYNLKLKSDALGKFPNKRSFLVSPPPISRCQCLLQPRPWNLESLRIDGERRYEGLLYLALRVDETAVAPGGGISLFLAFRNVSTCQVSDVRVTLEQECYRVSTKATMQTRLVTDTTASDADGTQKAILEDMTLVGLNLDGVRLSSISQNDGHNMTQGNNEEEIAKEMFRSLHSPLNGIGIRIPSSAKESYMGVQVRILHFITVSLIPACGGIDLPSLRFPVQVVGNNTGHQRSNPYSSPGTGVIQQQALENASVRIPMAIASPNNVTFGSYCVDPNEPYRDEAEVDNSSNKPSKKIDHSHATFLAELRGSLDEYDFVVERLKVLDWAIFLGSLNPIEFGSIIAHINSDFAKPRIGALLAQNYGGDFTCTHVAAAIQNTSSILRVNMVEGLLGLCSDLADGNEVVRCLLTDFEQIVVALHAIGVGDAIDVPNTGAEICGADRTGANEEASTIHTCDEKSSVQIDYNNYPRKEDVCIDDDQHLGTLEFICALKKAVSNDGGQEFSPRLYKRITSQFLHCRFMLRPFKDFPDYWRDASKKELIEFVGRTYEREVTTYKQKTASIPREISWEKPLKSRWEESLTKKGDDDWPLVITIHSYASSGLEQNENRPTSQDVFFGGSAKWSGNRAMILAVRRVLVEEEGGEWGPHVYKKIKSLLVPRKFFLPAGKNEWNEATINERISKLSSWYERERLAAVQSKQQAASVTQPSGEPSVEAAGALPNSPEPSVDEYARLSLRSSPQRGHTKTSEIRSPVGIAEHVSPFSPRSVRQTQGRLGTAIESPKTELNERTKKINETTASPSQKSSMRSPDRPKQSLDRLGLIACRGPDRASKIVDEHVKEETDSMAPMEQASSSHASVLQNDDVVQTTVPGKPDRKLKQHKSPKRSGFLFGGARSPVSSQEFVTQSPKGKNRRTLSVKSPSKNGESNTVGSPATTERLSKKASNMPLKRKDGIASPQKTFEKEVYTVLDIVSVDVSQVSPSGGGKQDDEDGRERRRQRRSSLRKRIQDSTRSPRSHPQKETSS